MTMLSMEQNITMGNVAKLKELALMLAQTADFAKMDFENALYDDDADAYGTAEIDLLDEVHILKSSIIAWLDDNDIDGACDAPYLEVSE